MAGQSLDEFLRKQDGEEVGVPGEVLRPLTPTFKAPKADEDVIPTRVKVPGKVAEAEKPEFKKAPREAAPPRRGTADERKLSEIGEQLQEKFDQASAVLSVALPVTGVYMADNSEKSVQALLSIAKRRPGMLKVLEKAADGVDVLTLAQFVAGLAVAFQVDRGQIPPDSLPAQATGVMKTFFEYFGDEPNPGDVNPNVVSQKVSHAQRFEPVL